jgi:hypothetical protein
MHPYRDRGHPHQGAASAPPAASARSAPEDGIGPLLLAVGALTALVGVLFAFVPEITIGTLLVMAALRRVVVPKRREPASDRDSVLRDLDGTPFKTRSLCGGGVIRREVS